MTRLTCRRLTSSMIRWTTQLLNRPGTILPLEGNIYRPKKYNRSCNHHQDQLRTSQFDHTSQDLDSRVHCVQAWVVWVNWLMRTITHSMFVLRKHLTLLKTHSFIYVLPSLPHTSSNSTLHVSVPSQTVSAVMPKIKIAKIIFIR